MSVYVSFSVIENRPWDEDDEALLSALPPARRDAVRRYAHVEDRRLSMYAVFLLADMMRVHFHMTDILKDIRWERGRKPFFASYPEIDFNYSHTRSAVLCGISSGGKIGIDLERRRRAPLKIMGSAFHPDEIDYVESFPLPEREGAFFEIWTRKEAYTKRNGTGLACDLTSINTLSLPDAFFMKWEQDSYICTVCLDSCRPVSFQSVSSSSFSQVCLSAPRRPV